MLLAAIAEQGPYTYLYRRESGKKRIKYIRNAEVARVREEIEAHRRFKRETREAKAQARNLMALLRGLSS